MKTLEEIKKELRNNKDELVMYEGTKVHTSNIDWLIAEKEMNYGYT